MSDLSPGRIMRDVAEYIPVEFHKLIVVIGSLAAGFHYFGDDEDREVRTKDIDCVVSPRVAATSAGKKITKHLLEAGWQPKSEIERPFPDTFDLLAHMSSNLTPNCAVAFPTAAVRELGLRFDESLPVFEDWEFLMRAAMALGVTSIAAETSLYRRLDHGNADTVENEAAWRAAHAAVIDRLSDRPVLLPVGDARRLAGTHFQIGGRSRHESELVDAEAELDRLTRSPIRWMAAFADRVRGAISHRIEERRP